MSQTPLNRVPLTREQLLQRGPLLVALLAIVIGLCLLCIFAALLVRDFVGVGDIAGQEPTPFPTAAAAGDDVIIAGVSGSTAISLSLNVPTSLQLADQTFGVRAEPVEEDGTWEPEVGEGDTALWVYGTLINYVIGLPDSDENREMLEGMAPGDEMVLKMRDGTTYRFAVTNREYVPTTRQDIFAQNLPGITLILLRARGDERLVVQGDYVVDVMADNGAGNDGNMVELGETAQLEELRITVTEASALFDQPQAPSGFLFYLVDFQIQNAGTEPINLNDLRFTLVDEMGNQYAINTQASQQFGNYGALNGNLMPGETRQASVGYLIPAGLTSPTLTWVVRREGTSGEVRVTIPFAGSTQEAARSAIISLQSAEVTDDGTGVTLVGQITNGGSQPLVVESSAVSLDSNGTVHLMLSTNPAFPWVIPPGQTAPFSLTFQRPAAGEAIFTILNQPFQLSGLR